jgi:hypothetical protein
VVVDVVVDVVVAAMRVRPSTSRPSAPACRRIGGGAVSDVTGATATAPAKTVCKTRRTIGGAPPATRNAATASTRTNATTHESIAIASHAVHAHASPQHAVRTP